MACRKCGSDWTTPTGKDCNRCPHCDKQQLFQARKQGRWAEPTQVKQCVQCGKEFTAVGLKHIKQKILCDDPACRKAHRKAGIKRRESGVFVGPRPGSKCKPDRFCKRCGKGPLNRNQKDYCGRECAGADAREFKRPFMGMPAELRKAAVFASWFVDDWERERPIWMECEGCRKKIERQSSMQRVCSEACRYRLENPLHDECIDCGIQLNADTRYVRRCEPCRIKRKKANRAKNRKRCKKFGVPYDASVKSKAVFKRDGYQCQLCNKICLSKFTLVNGTPHPRSPTVDHIFALSLGIKGHTWDNVQCACWSCNVAKGARAAGQLRLAGC